MDRASPGPINLDDPAYVATFFSDLALSVKDTKSSQPRLRGGQRDVSQAWSETPIDIQHEQTEETIGSAESSKFGGQGALPTKTTFSPVVKIESPEVKLEAVPKYVPLEEQEISRATYGPPTRNTPLVSVTYRKPSQLEHLETKSISDDEMENNSFTPTQRRVMEKTPKESQTANKPSPNILETQKSAPRVFQESTTPSKTSNSGMGEVEYDGPLGFMERVVQKYAQEADERLKQKDSADLPTATPQGRASSLNPVAEEFKSSTSVQPTDDHQNSRTEPSFEPATASQSEQDKVLPVPQLTAQSTAHLIRDVQQQEEASVLQKPAADRSASSVENKETPAEAGETDEAGSKGGLDITPMLKALVARANTASSAGSDKGADTDDSDQKQVCQQKEQDTPTSQVQTIANEDTNVIEAESTHQEMEQMARTVLLSKLPQDADYGLLTRLIQGGRVESMLFQRDTSTALVTFVRNEDAHNYAHSRKLGIAFRYHGQQHHISVELLPDTSSPDAVLQAYHSCGATRVVEVEDIKETYTIKDLHKLALGLFGRQMECIVDTYKPVGRVTSFRFASVQDAVDFRNMLSNGKEWKKLLISFGGDPCEQSS